MTVLAVFRSRSQTLRFASVLRAAGVPLQTVNTPSQLGLGCGLSARFEDRFLPQAKLSLRRGDYSSFVGFFSSRTLYGRTDFFRV